MSGGQQQRVAIARALANEPPSCCATRPRARSTRARRCPSSSCCRTSTASWASPSW
ncbi:hypothetical protein [Eggerthella sinensis]|uniref:hypothetical protein n=1 Tax=Eggerthella sinensis TaxID=242230 RepID=UPI0022E1A03A|nr:hypothetical protein [Eggerthella sinensis]